MDHIVKIQKITTLTHDVKQFEVEKPTNYTFTPGQATDVSINQEGWRDKKHAFTFTSLGSDNFLQFTIKSYPVSEYPNHEGVTEKIHTLKTGDEFVIDDPWGTIKYKGKGVFIAGGAGITPFIAIFKQLDKDGQLKGNKLFFSNKTSQDIILEKDLKRWFGAKNLILTLTREKNVNFSEGRIDKKFLTENTDNFSQHFYLCGKGQMVSQLTEVLKQLGAKTDSVVFEK